MLITKFNRMVRSRILWGIFALIVSVCFVGAFSSAGGGGCTPDNRGGVGMLFGKPVSGREFTLARYFALGLREVPNLTADMDKMLHRQTWRRLAALRMAERLGITVAPEELLQQLQNSEQFQVNGVFSRERYAAVLDAQHLTPQLYEQYVTEELSLRKLFVLLESAVWAPSSEVERRVQNMTERVSVEYVFLDPSRVTVPPVTEEQARAYFNEHPEDFRVPKRVNVRYVELPVTNLLAQVAVDDDGLRTFYSNHVERYSTTDTNGVSTTEPFEKVRDAVEREVRREKALLLAKDKAAEFAMDLVPDRSGNRRSFDGAARALGLTVRTSEFFSVREAVPGLRVERTFNEEAFKLDGTDPERYFSDAILTGDAAYVIATNASLASYLPDFSNVVARVIPLAHSNAAHRAFVAYAQETRDAVHTSLTAGKSFANALKERRLQVTSNLSYVAYDASPQQVPHFYVLVPQTMGLSAGEVSPVLEVEGGALVAHIRDRQAGETVSTQLMKPRVAETIDRYRGSFVFEDWADYVLTVEAGFVDLAASSSASSAAADEDEDTAAPARERLPPDA